jgi:hypothetical protein
MSRLTYANTILRTDEGIYRAGDVIRSTSNESPWCQCIILGFSTPDKHNDVYVRLARPFAYAHCVGTTSPGILMSAEEFTISASKLKYETVLTRNGESPMVEGGPRPHYDSEVINTRRPLAVDPSKLPAEGSKLELLRSYTSAVCAASLAPIERGDLSYWMPTTDTVYHPDALPEAMRDMGAECKAETERK